MPVTKENVDDVFTYHAPDDEQHMALDLLRVYAKQLAYHIVDRVPMCGDQQAALRSLRECVHMANAAIMLKGQV